jgi:hypothetical protein
VIHEKEMLPAVLAQIEEEIAQVSADTGYDYQICYHVIASKGARVVFHPGAMDECGTMGRWMTEMTISDVLRRWAVKSGNRRVVITNAV